VFEPAPVRTRLIFRMRGEVSSVLDIGEVAGGRRRVMVIGGGSVEGPQLSGEVLPGGADWQLVAADGSISIEARYTIRASDGGLILVHSRGVRAGAGAVLARVAAGEAVDPRDYYFRTWVTLETQAPAHTWACGRLFVGVAAREPHAAVIDTYEIL
jgi:hypothetical protein